ncbi:hypothetical protein SFMTTN_1575 [Sulfuriferula multivorans]|uniref:Uncharacterized protein n=1 Tax=Sulfuriferula multivorans TaxID=1559896 RepID=A0A401JDU3_9PROT|nr:hypothetical protein SFMTTN_1575 [Sulfuriferula multivorans]
MMGILKGAPLMENVNVRFSFSSSDDCFSTLSSQRLNLGAKRQ